MLTLDSPQFTDLMHTAMTLGARDRYQEVVNLLESNLANMAPDCHPNAYMELLKAHLALGNHAKVTDYAQRVDALKPGLPSVQSYLNLAHADALDPQTGPPQTRQFAVWKLYASVAVAATLIMVSIVDFGAKINPDEVQEVVRGVTVALGVTVAVHVIYWMYTKSRRK